MNRRNFLFGTGSAALQSDALQRVEAATKSIKIKRPAEVASDEDFWFEVRHAFTIDRNIINLNNGSVCPSPKIVQDAMLRYLEVMHMQPSYYVDELLIPHSETVRRRLAATFGCDSEEIAITRNATEALEIVQLGLDLKPGDEVLTTTQDYPSMLTTWRQRERRDGIVLKTFPFPTPPSSLHELYKCFERTVTPRTRVIMLCHVTYTTGQIFPVRDICRMARSRGIETIVDGAHAFAHFPFRRDDLDCDYYGSSLHKWLTAPIGTGFLYVKREKIGKIWPLMPAPETIRENIRKFEAVGTFPIANKNAITEALAFLDSIGLERKAARLQYLRERWSRRIARLPSVEMRTSLDPAQACGIGAFAIKGIDCGKLTDYLMQKHAIHVRPRYVPSEFSAIRVTPNIYTTLEEIDTFSAAIEQVVEHGIS